MLAGHDVVLVVGAPRAAPVRLRARPAVRRGHPRRGGHRGLGGGAPRGRRAGRRGPAGRRLRGAGRARRRPRGRRPPRRASVPPAPAPPGAGRAAARRPRPGRARRAAPARRGADRGDAVEPAGAARARARARAARLPQRRMGGLGFALPARDRPAHGAPGPPGRRRRRRRRLAVPDPGAVERGPLRRRRAVHRARQRRATRSWTGSPRRPASAARGRAFEAVDVAAVARGFGCPAQTIEDHDTLLRTLDEVLPSLAERSEPLLLEVVVSPDTTFEP